MESYEFFVYFEYYLFIRYMTCKDSLPFSWLPFLFADGFLCCTETFYLIQSYLFILAFVTFAYGLRFKKNITRICVKSFLPIYFSRSLMVSELIVKTLINFELFLYIV